MVAGPHVLQVTGLRCESLHNPLGMDERIPMLSWQVEGDGRVEVESGGLRLWADPDDVRGTVTVGGEVRVHFPNEYRNISPGYYVVLGNADTGEHAGQIRLYWNLVPSVGPLIVERISACLNVADIGFRLKLLKDPSHASRTDAGVLYLPFSHLERALPLLREVYHEVRDHLHPPVSAFVHRVAAGLGLAEDMTDGTSFGVHRSQLLAHIVIAARGHAAPQARTVALLHAAGHDPDRFFVNAGSAREYPTW